ncbi:MAG: hypothetical protein WCS42_13435 [Verrucomicrobiota bacterium]
MEKLKQISKLFSLVLALAIFLKATPELFAQTTSGDYRFDGSISFQVLQNYLSRAIHMGRFCAGVGEGRAASSSVGNVDENIRMVTNIGAKYFGRVIVIWGQESQVPQGLEKARAIGLQVHAADPDVILEGAILECVTPDVNKLPIPAYVFRDLGLPVETRNFRCADMLYLNNPVYQTGKVPDITKQETKLWFYYLATSYIDAGLEAIHWGVIDAIGGKDRAGGWQNYYDLFARVRAYASQHARRHFVLCNGDINKGIAVGGKLLFDFHSGTLHATGMKEVSGKPGQCILTGKFISVGGITPSGWACTSLPYLLHVDNSGYSGKGGQGGLGGKWAWGYDEISWFANQPEEYRNKFLGYADDYIRNCYPDSIGHLEMPGIRVVSPAINGKDFFFANSITFNPLGFNQEETIRQIWAGQWPAERQKQIPSSHNSTLTNKNQPQ